MEVSEIRGSPWTDVLESWFPSGWQEIYNQALEEWDRSESRNTLYDGIVDEIRKIQSSGIKLGLVSSKSRKYILMDLAEFSLAGFFGAVVGVEDTDLHKPHPDPLLKASAILGSHPSECIYVGDQPTDIAAARSAGMRSAAAMWGEGDESLIGESEPDFIISSPGELLSSVYGQGLNPS